jgi:uncharacterized Zn finger protein
LSFQWKPYVSAAARRRKAEKAAARLHKNGQTLAPLTAGRSAIAKTFWGKSWCSNLEHYSDFSNRLPRGRTYLRNGSVLDLQIVAGEVSAQVMGSRLYKVAVSIAAVPKTQWQAIGKDCADSIDSLVELLQGHLSKNVMERICRPGTGLFPTPREIEFTCSCPDWAAMCKHVAAVFYGIGARLDMQPELLFTLRKVDAKDLIAGAGEALPQTNKRASAARILDDSRLVEVFGIEMAEPIPERRSRGKSAAPKRKQPATRKSKTAKRGAVASARKKSVSP